MSDAATKPRPAPRVVEHREPSTEVARINPAPAPMGFAEVERLAISVARSGLFGMKTPEQALALMMISQAEGRHPALAARDYDVIQGRPSKKAEAMMRDFMEAGGKVVWTTLSDDTADATFSHPQGGTVRIVWDIDRAKLAGLAGKDNWKKFPRQMLRSRTVSEGVRTVWPLATSGLFVPEEVADFTGPTIEHQPEAPVPSHAPPPVEDPDRIRRFLNTVRERCQKAATPQDVNRILTMRTVTDARKNDGSGLRDDDRAELEGMLAEAIGRVNPREADPDRQGDDGDTANEPENATGDHELPPAGTPEREWWDISGELDRVQTAQAHTKLALQHSERIAGWKDTHPELYRNARAAFESKMQLLRATA